MGEIRNIATGVAVLTDWLGDGGKPVSQELAERRAAVCVDCVENRAPRWWERSKSVIARAILRQLDAKREMKIATSVDDKLHMCRVCGCATVLKCHVPIEHIAGHIDLDRLQEFPAGCWQKREIEGG